MDVENINVRHNALPGYGIDFDDKESRLAVAISDALVVFGGGGGGGSGGSTDATTIAAGIDTSTDINSILAELQAINANTDELELKTDNLSLTIDAIEVDTTEIEANLDAILLEVTQSAETLGETGDIAIDSATDGTISSRLRAIQENLEGTNATLIDDSLVTVTGTNAVVSPGNASTIELYVQNKSETAGENVYIRNNGAATFGLSITLFPGGSHVYAGVEAQQALTAITRGGNIDLYVKRVNG